MRVYLPLIGFILILVGALFIILGNFKSGATNAKFAFGGFIGPFPFGFANSPTMLWIIIGITLAWVVINFILR